MASKRLGNIAIEHHAVPMDERKPVTNGLHNRKKAPPQSLRRLRGHQNAICQHHDSCHQRNAIDSIAFEWKTKRYTIHKIDSAFAALGWL
jgi:hypothetical protein